MRFVDVLEQMGLPNRSRTPARVLITVHGGPLHGIDVDMNDISDTVMTLAAVACFAEGPTTIRNVAHIRHKETDRLAALATELRRIGAAWTNLADGLTITPGPAARGGDRANVQRSSHGDEPGPGRARRFPASSSTIPAASPRRIRNFFDDLERLR